jgi:glycerol-1-phosphate dehydrogenase [NAD(P)+]
LTMARIQGEMLRATQPQLGTPPSSIDKFLEFYGPNVGAVCWQSFARKMLDRDRLAAVNLRLARGWTEIRQAIRAVHRSATVLESALRRCGAPTRPTDLGLADDAYGEAVLHAREIRDRYTFLDFAADCGALPRILGAMPVLAQ